MPFRLAAGRLRQRLLVSGVGQREPQHLPSELVIVTHQNFFFVPFFSFFAQHGSACKVSSGIVDDDRTLADQENCELLQRHDERARISSCRSNCFQIIPRHAVRHISAPSLSAMRRKDFTTRVEVSVSASDDLGSRLGYDRSQGRLRPVACYRVKCIGYREDSRVDCELPFRTAIGGSRLPSYFSCCCPTTGRAPDRKSIRSMMRRP